MIEFLGWAPDADPATPGVITDCVQLIPSVRGMISAPSAASVSGLGALPAQCRGAAVLTNTAGTRRTFAGTQTSLYELSASTWAGVGAGTYNGSSENRWCFAQFGNAALATNDGDAIQSSTSGTFAAVATAPKARIIVSVPNFVVALNTNDATGSATYGDAPDRWWCSGFQDHTDWTPAVATQCTTGRLIGGGGEITAGAPFGNGLIAYKARSMFMGHYVGSPAVFQFDEVPGAQGCVGPEAVCDIGGAHVFVGEDNIWLFDGSRPVPIAQDTVRQWFYNDLSAANKYRVIVTHDRTFGRVWVFYPSATSTGAPDSAIVYSLASRRWGRANRSIEAALTYSSPGITWDTMDSVGATWDTLPDTPWDSQSWQASGRALGVFTASHNLVTLTGGGEDCGLTTGYIGDDERVSSVNQIRLRFFTEPTSGSVAGQARDGLGNASANIGSGSLVGSKFDIRQSAHWHRFVFSFTGNTEVSGIDVRAVPSGSR